MPNLPMLSHRIGYSLSSVLALTGSSLTIRGLEIVRATKKTMSILKGISALFGLLLCTAFAIAFLPNVADLVNTSRTDPAVETGLTCTTNGAGDCTITLADAHMHADTSGMTVDETSPSTADRTSNTTVGADRVTLSLTGLAAITLYTFTVDYEKVDAQASTATGLPDFLNLAPIIFVLMMLVVGVIVGGAAMSRTFN